MPKVGIKQLSHARICSRPKILFLVPLLFVASIIGVARGGQGRAFALPSLNFALPSKVAKQVN